MRNIIQQFQPIYFALVMSTGVISLAAEALQMKDLAEALLYLNVLVYPLLLVLLFLRAITAFAGLRAELTSHEKGATFLAFVPATCLLGSQVVQLQHNSGLGSALWLLGAGAWVVLLYAFWFGVSIGDAKPQLGKGLNGSWLLMVVATESLAVLGTKLASSWAVPVEVSLFTMLSLFLLGGLLYVVLMCLLVYRLTFKPLAGEEIGATYWIGVGASAITVLAGTTLVTSLKQSQALPDLLPFIKGGSLLFWAVSTWWIPLVAGLRLWNHLTTRPPFQYAPTYWSMVFPLGMYTAATLRLAEALPLPALRVVPAYSIYVALLAWLLTFGAMLYHLITAAAKPAAL
ncbi:C4-dicarboxylate ABC transporter [Hymenobacter taeanensis]|uniref:C4-dicarboxylate ABC transporter n=1 Tax=Hymenobacter taeanensis TaxID=2735321 RepID=A0A6M6BN85_9BACT|nr:MULTISPECIES: tellurite resistance/C4-dicarboxylate transporter family protein [Hymenobacter]QJX48963.1 C4-dicarboxylate ABC transporter [Hymenobacter taeanensis]UOQ81522.1 tellurite resistance/C4-dicarboxylate transporter family protein [Hymenobacter sp. 5414T-23]